MIERNNLWNGPLGTYVLDSGAPFYKIYKCADGKYMGIGSIEAKFYKDLLKVFYLLTSGTRAKCKRDVIFVRFLIGFWYMAFVGTKI